MAAKTNDADDILDNMSMSSDDEMDDMLDDLADEMFNDTTPSTSAPAPSRQQRPPPPQAAMQRRGNPADNGGGMPDLSQMMTQMMPMMNQLLGANQSNINNQQRQIKVDWESLLSESEAAEWKRCFALDATRQTRDAVDFCSNRPFSHAYKAKSLSLADAADRQKQHEANMKLLTTERILVSLLRSGVRGNKSAGTNAWKLLDDGKLAQELVDTGLADIFKTKSFLPALQARVKSDPDFNATQFPSISEAIKL